MIEGFVMGVLQCRWRRTETRAVEETGRRDSLLEVIAATQRGGQIERATETRGRFRDEGISCS
jgi:hypothetical protein